MAGKVYQGEKESNIIKPGAERPEEIIHCRQPLYKYHADEAKRFFNKFIKDYVKHLDHMCITVALPDGTLMMQSPIPDVEDHYYVTKEARNDQGLSAKFYTNFKYYCWKDAVVLPHARGGAGEYNELRESLYALYNGYFIVRKLEDIHIVCGIASHCKDPRMTTVFFNNINKIAELCDFYYMSLWHRFSEHTQYKLPKINKFDKLVDDIKLEEAIAINKKEEEETNKAGIILPPRRPFLRIVK